MSLSTASKIPPSHYTALKLPLPGGGLAKGAGVECFINCLTGEDAQQYRLLNTSSGEIHAAVLQGTMPEQNRALQSAHYKV